MKTVWSIAWLLPRRWHCSYCKKRRKPSKGEKCEARRAGKNVKKSGKKNRKKR